MRLLGCRKKRQGFALSLDALAAVGLLLTLAVFLGSLVFSSASPELSVQRLSTVSRDILLVLDTPTVGQLEAEHPALADLLAAGALNETDRDRTPLDVIGDLWAAGNVTEAKNITSSIVSAMLGNTSYSAQIFLGGTELYLRNASATVRFLTRQRAVASGIESGKPTLGHIARAWVIAASKNNTLLVLGDVVTSAIQKKGGNNQNEVNVTYRVDVPADANVTNASAYVENAAASANFKVYINGNFVYQASGKDFRDITPFIQPGNNTVDVVSRFGSGTGTEGGDDGSTHFIVAYNTTTLTTITQPARFPLFRVRSELPIRYKKPVFVRGNVTAIGVQLNFTNATGGTQIRNATLNITWKGVPHGIGLKNVTNGTVSWNASEISDALAADGLSVAAFSTGFFWAVVDVDQYVAQGLPSYERIINDLTSFVDVNYTTFTSVFGKIDITRQADLANYTDADAAAGFYRFARWNFTLPNSSEALAAVFQLPWLYWASADPRQVVQGNAITLYNHTPGGGPDPLTVEFARFGYTPASAFGAMLTGENNNLSINFSAGSSINPSGALAFFTSLTPGIVGYGAVFPNETAALADALARLAALLGPLVTATNIGNDTQALGDVPSLWGPTQLDIRVWI